MSQPPGARLVHIGPPKTGTTAVQGAFHQERERLAEFGVSYAGSGRQPLSAVVAFTGLDDMFDVRGAPRASVSAWDALVGEVRRLADDQGDRVVISSELFATCDDAHAHKAIEDLGGPARVVVTLRPLHKIMPSSWQQYVKGGGTLSYEDWLRRLLDEPADDALGALFWRWHRHDALVERWADVVGPRNVTVIVVDESDPLMLLREFETLLELPEGTLRPDKRAVNESLTLSEVETIRQLNLAYEERGWPDARHLRYVRNGLLIHLQLRPPPDRGEPRITTPPWAVERIAALGAEFAEKISMMGVGVVGDLGSLGLPPSDSRAATATVADPPALALSPERVAGLLVGAITAGAGGKEFERELITARYFDAETDLRDLRWEDGAVTGVVSLRFRHGDGRPLRIVDRNGRQVLDPPGIITWPGGDPLEGARVALAVKGRDSGRWWHPEGGALTVRLDPLPDGGRQLTATGPLRLDPATLADGDPLPRDTHDVWAEATLFGVDQRIRVGDGTPSTIAAPGPSLVPADGDFRRVVIPYWTERGQLALDLDERRKSLAAELGLPDAPGLVPIVPQDDTGAAGSQGAPDLRGFPPRAASCELRWSGDTLIGRPRIALCRVDGQPVAAVLPDGSKVADRRLASALTALDWRDAARLPGARLRAVVKDRKRRRWWRPDSALELRLAAAGHGRYDLVIDGEFRLSAKAFIGDQPVAANGIYDLWIEAELDGTTRMLRLTGDGPPTAAVEAAAAVIAGPDNRPVRVVVPYWTNQGQLALDVGGTRHGLADALPAVEEPEESRGVRRRWVRRRAGLSIPLPIAACIEAPLRLTARIGAGREHVDVDATLDPGESTTLHLPAALPGALKGRQPVTLRVQGKRSTAPLAWALVRNGRLRRLEPSGPR